VSDWTTPRTSPVAVRRRETLRERALDRESPLRQLDWILLAAVLCLCTLGALLVWGATLAAGSSAVGGALGIPTLISRSDLVITGEGRSDRQTLLSKAPFVVARHARALAVPVTLLSGAVDPAALDDLERHFAGCFALPHGPMPLDECIRDAAALLASRAEALAYVIAAAVK